MKYIKRIVSIMLVLSLSFCLFACSRQSSKNTVSSLDVETTAPSYKGDKIKVAAISGPTGMGMLKLFETNIYDMKLVTDPTTIPSLLLAGDVDIAACPLNMASALYNKTNGGIRMIAINTLGVLHIVSSTEIKSLKDLSGKTIYSAGQGTTAEYILSYVLKNNKLEDEVKVEYLSEHSEVASKLVSGDIEIAVLPEPFVSVAKNSKPTLTAAINLNDEWQKLEKDAKLAMGCIITTEKFAKENSEAVAQFAASCRDSVEYVNLNPVDALNAIVKNGILPESVIYDESNNDKENKIEFSSSEEAAKTVDRCNLVFVEVQSMKQIAEVNFNILFDFDKSSVGGAVPGEDLYLDLSSANK